MRRIEGRRPRGRGLQEDRRDPAQLTPAMHARDGASPSITPAAAAIHRLQGEVGNRAVTSLLHRVPEVPAPDTSGFSATELDWIDEVWANPGIQMLFLAYDGVPAPVLSRVRTIFDSDTGAPSPTTEGVHRPTEEEGDVNIEIADSAYTIHDRALSSDGSVSPATTEEEFKSVLIHEMMHFFEHHTHDLDPQQVPTIGTIELFFTYPEHFGFGPFAFGWFEHESGRVVHLDDVSISEFTTGDAWKVVAPGSAPAQAKEAGKYEARADARNLEEDIGTTIAYFLTSAPMRALLQEKYPVRYRAMASFFTKLLPKHVSMKVAP